MVGEHSPDMVGEHSPDMATSNPLRGAQDFIRATPI